MATSNEQALQAIHDAQITLLRVVTQIGLMMARRFESEDEAYFRAVLDDLKEFDAGIEWDEGIYWGNNPNS